MNKKSTDEILYSLQSQEFIMIQNGQIIIRTETASDFAAASDVVRQAFGPLTESDHKEHLLVGRLRRSKAFIPELSLVAETQ